MTWGEIGRDNLEAAKLLKEADRFRSSVSRAYYAALSLLTHHLPGDTLPKHQTVPGLLDKELSQLPVWQRRKLRSLFVRLRRMREDADYDRHVTTDETDALDALNYCGTVLEILNDL